MRAPLPHRREGDNVEIRQLRSFVAVAHGLSFSRAALHLHISQPALSAQIKSLEADLGAKLFERNRRTVRLTPAGSALLADAESLLQRIAEIGLRVARISAGEIGHLRIGFVASATLEIVPAIALAFRRQHPGVGLELKNLSTVQQVDALRNGSLDAGFVRMPLAEKDLLVTRIHSEPFALVVAKNHPLARTKNISIADVANEPFIAYGRRWAPSFYEVWTAICHNAGFEPTVIQETGEMSTAVALVAAGLGVAIIPEGITRGYRHLVNVKILQRERIRSEIGIATLATRTTALVQHLIATAKRAAPR
jgi:LysR family transcriptional regulator, benzoate and cis,cis-muconate-responsive activator of ben and cat genes